LLPEINKIMYAVKFSGGDTGPFLGQQIMRMRVTKSIKGWVWGMS